MQHQGIKLALFAALTTAPVAVINVLTENEIVKQVALQQQAMLNEVIPADWYNNDLKAECYVVTDNIPGSHDNHRLWLARMDGEPVAIAIESTAPDGWAGAIKLLIGADISGQILGTRVVKHQETPGLGDKIDIRVSGWIQQFNGKRVTPETLSEWAVKKDGGIFDQFTGATVTPRAVINAVKHTLTWLDSLSGQFSSLARCEAQ